MEILPNYDEWKATPPDEKEPLVKCNCCGDGIPEGEAIYTIDGGICESCLNDNYRSFV